MKIKLLALVLLFNSIFVFSQDKLDNSNSGKRISITNPSETIIKKILESGIDLRCGANHTHEELKLDLTYAEIKQLDKANIKYNIEIEDITKFYSERAKRDMPNAQSLLKIEKAKSKTLNKSITSSKSSNSISSTVIDSYLQYYGETEEDWAVPTNFNIPTTFGGCLTVSETEAELDAMRAAYPNLITVKTDASPSNMITHGFAGTGGWPGYTVYYVKISDNPDGADDANEPDILYTSMIHSRELSSLMGNIYFMWFLLENYATNSAIKHLVDNNELFFVPIVNPDGLRWNEKEDPNGGGMNRTNLRGYSTSDPTNNSNYIENYGVDPNRNFDYLWGSAGDASGSSSNYWWSTYRGPSAFSEPESQIMRDFILSKNFKTAVWQHSYANAIPHPYGGIPTKVSLREDEMARWHQDMTRYNRYISGAQVLSPANGIADDWMLGGTVDGNGSTGSGMNILATTPENGANDSSEGGFWPAPSDIIPIAKRMVRINLMNAYYGGKYAKFHDLTQSDVAALSSDLTFGVERIGQTSSDFTLQITPTSSNIQSITSPLPATLAGMSVLEQRNVTAALVLNSGIVANEKIEYKVSLSNDDGIIYEANFVKYYQPSVLFEDNPDTDISISNWVVSTNWVNSNLSSWSGSRAIKAGAAIPYASNVNNTLTTTNSYDLSGGNEILIQFYSKWDLERNFDFVEIEGYNGSSWVKLNGKYNKPESSSFTNSARSSYSSDKSVYFNSQATSSGLVYDGDQMDNWVMEEIVIDASNNSSLQNVSNAKFRFNFRTDGNNIGEVNYSSTYEGFYLDDFKIIQITVPCVVSTPTGLNSSLITSSSATVGWDLISSATYDLRYRVVGSSTWTDVLDMATNSHNLTGLTSNTNYEYQVRSVCGATSSSYSSSSLFTTLEPNYCDSSGDTSNRGITNVTFVGETTINKTSISSVDYSDFTDIFSTVDIGNTYNLSITGLTQKITGQTPALNVSVFIDFNGDGDFLDSGETFNNIGTFSDPTPTTISNYGILVPNDSKTGATRMRISAKASSTSSSCETGFSGEVEDYKINIIDSTLGIQDELLSEFVLYPNPVKNGQLKLNVPREITDFNVAISNVLGQTVFERKINDNYSTAHTVNTSNLNPGIYFVTVSTNLGMATKKMIIQ